MVMVRVWHMWVQFKIIAHVGNLIKQFFKHWKFHIKNLGGKEDVKDDGLMDIRRLRLYLTLGDLLVH